MHVICPHCGQNARITSRNTMNEEKTIFDLYCTCANSTCDASFVVCLAYNRTINLPVKITALIEAEKKQKNKK